MATATLEGIRDRCAVLITAIAPVSLTGNAFRQTRDETNADFRKMAESAPAGCLRRFQVLDDGSDDLPPVSDTITAQLVAHLVILVAYPQSYRYGAANGRDRRDVLDEDWRKLNFALGIYGRANFSGANDCTPIGCRKQVEIGTAGVDYLVVHFDANYYLTVNG